MLLKAQKDEPMRALWRDVLDDIINHRMMVNINQCFGISYPAFAKRLPLPAIGTTIFSISFILSAKVLILTGSRHLDNDIDSIVQCLEICSVSWLADNDVSCRKHLIEHPHFALNNYRKLGSNLMEVLSLMISMPIGFHRHFTIPCFQQARLEITNKPAALHIPKFSDFHSAALLNKPSYSLIFSGE